MNELSLKFFAQMADKKNVNPNDVKLAHNTDFSDIDVAFVMKYADKNSHILDLGAGTGLMINKMYQNVGKIIAVEPFQSFSKFIVKANNVEIYHEDMFDYIPETKIDIIIAFGTMHYVDEPEATLLYEKYLQYLKPGGVFIIKNQFGLEEDVNVAGYSEEQKTDYWSQYRHIKKEQQILTKIGYEVVEVCDIYPPECNRWPNTHFFAIVGKKP